MKNKIYRLIIILVISLSSTLIIGCNNSQVTESSGLLDEKNASIVNNVEETDVNYVLYVSKFNDEESSEESYDVEWEKVDLTNIKECTDLEYGIFPLQGENNLLLMEQPFATGYTAFIPYFDENSSFSDYYIQNYIVKNSSTNKGVCCYDFDEYMGYINKNQEWGLERVAIWLDTTRLIEIGEQYFHFEVSSYNRMDAVGGDYRLSVYSPISNIYTQETKEYYIMYYITGGHHSDYPMLHGEIYPKNSNSFISFYLEHSQINEENMESIAHQIAKFSCKK